MINIGSYQFNGPFDNTSFLIDASGVYVILCVTANSTTVVDIGESHAVKNRVENHDRADCWKKHCSGSLRVAVYYTPYLQQAGRKKVEQELRQQYAPVCGDR